MSPLKVLFSALVVSCSLLSINVSAQQSFKPTTLWPYVNGQFTFGTVYLTGGQTSDASLNVHLMSGELHQLSGDNITSLPLANIDSVRIGKVTFVPVDGCLCQLLGHSEHVVVVKKVIGDFNKLMSGTGAYGSTLSTSGRRELTSLEIGGINQTNHGFLLQNRDNAQYLPVKTSRLVVVYSAEGGKPQVVEASSRSVRDLIHESRQEEWKSVLKSAKIKWSNDESVGDVAPLLEKFLW